MTTTAERRRAYSGPALFSMGFRPFFLFAALWAALSVPLWIAAHSGLPPRVHFSAAWHAHEMLFGYLGAVIAGFLLTAVPNWTGRMPVAGPPLMALFGVWAAGRAAMLISEHWPGAVYVDSAFLFLLAAIIAREVIAGRNIRNAFICVLVAMLAGANALFHLGGELSLLAQRTALGVIAMLLALIGGRIVPSFTRNWMARHGVAHEPAPHSRFDAASLALTGSALAFWILAPDSLGAGAALTLAGLVNAKRLARWRGWRTSGEWLVFVLHIGYCWLALAFGLMGIAILAPSLIAPTAGLHALTAGAFGVMTLAVMTRASLGHTGQALTANRRIRAIYLLANFGAAARVASPFLPEANMPLLIASALLWCAAFLLFVLVYYPLLLRPRQILS